jgi:hypothetical protein
MVDIYRGLRCRPGDLAVIVQDEPACRANIGQIVRVLKEYTEFPESLGCYWLVQPLSNQPSPVLVGTPGTGDLRLTHDNAPRAHYDGWLSPLLETPEPQEELQAEGRLTEWSDPAHFHVT